jgi:hypothetical protein
MVVNGTVRRHVTLASTGTTSHDIPTTRLALVSCSRAASRVVKKGCWSDVIVQLNYLITPVRGMGLVQHVHRPILLGTLFAVLTSVTVACLLEDRRAHAA